MAVTPRKPKKEEVPAETQDTPQLNAEAPAPVPEPSQETAPEPPQAPEPPREAAPAEPAPETAPSGPLTQAEIDAGLLRVLRQRNTHSPTPTLLKYRMRDSVKKRSVFVDIDVDTMAAAWRWWRETVGGYDQESFVIAVHRVMEASLPRVYRQVDPLELD